MRAEFTLPCIAADTAAFFPDSLHPIIRSSSYCCTLSCGARITRITLVTNHDVWEL
ncbi:hypothetical protein B0H19DRAFT_1184133, partial [Mycena capillaripes]